MKITNFYVMDGRNGQEILADPRGNNIAILCMSCGAPILLTALSNQYGSDEDHPAECRSCGSLYFLDIRAHKEMLYIHKITGKR